MSIHTVALNDLNNFHHYIICTLMPNQVLVKYEINTFLNPFHIRLKLHERNQVYMFICMLHTLYIGQD